MSTTTYDWTKFTKRILIDTTLEQAYFSFASRKGMESWFLRLCEYKRNDINLNPEELAIAGDIYKFLWHGWPDLRRQAAAFAGFPAGTFLSARHPLPQ